MNCKRFKILIIDYKIKNIKKLVKIFKDDEYDITYSTNSMDALSMIKNTKYDLVIVERKMPVINGFDICKIIKYNEYTRYIPIIIIISNRSRKEIINAFDNGVQDYIIKPYSNNELLSKVKKYSQQLSHNDLLGLYFKVFFPF